MNEGQLRFLVRARAGTLWTPERKGCCLGMDNACIRGFRCIRSLAHILNNCNRAWNEMTEKHNDICRIIGQYLNKFKSQIISLEENKTQAMKLKIGWNSQINLPFKFPNEDEENDNDVEGFEEARKRKPDLWFWKFETETIKRESFKILSLNLIEVSFPYG
jgi:hypothetical protein